MKRSWKLKVRRAHRWIAMIVGVQVLAWIVGGLYFSIIPIETIRGEHLLASATELDPAALQHLSMPAQWEVGDLPILNATIANDPDGPLLLVTTRDGIVPVDLTTGQRRPPLAAEQAQAIAVRRFIPSANVVSVERLTAVAPDHEYRGRPLPAWQVRFDHDSGARVYVSETTGQVTALRTDYWRVFDFLWMLHIMDYDTRDNFNHWLLTLAAALALIAAAAGVATWWTTTPLWRRLSSGRKRRQPRSAV